MAKRVVLNPPPEPELLQKLRKLYQDTETQLLEEISRKRARGLMDYAQVAALGRVQQILQGMVDTSWKYVPRLIEGPFYKNHPEAARRLESVAKHAAGYANARNLTSTETAIANRLVYNLMGEITQAAASAKVDVEQILLGRQQEDIFRKLGLEVTAQAQAAGQGAAQAAAELEQRLRQEGITAFVDRAGRRWSLSSYANMVARTTSRQAEVLAVLTKDPEHDLYQISSHGTTCPLCAPYEGRVYSRSGNSPDYPPLAAAFGKVDPSGPDTLENSYLNIHPNCLHSISRYTTAGKTEEEIEKDKAFSSFEKNPPTVDPRSQKQIAEYRRKQEGRRKLLAANKQFQKYQRALGDKVPKRFETFLRHKIAGDDKYKEWVRLYKEKSRPVPPASKPVTPQEMEQLREDFRAALYKMPQPYRQLLQVVDNQIEFVPREIDVTFGYMRKRGVIVYNPAQVRQAIEDFGIAMINTHEFAHVLDFRVFRSFESEGFMKALKQAIKDVTMDRNYWMGYIKEHTLSPLMLDFLNAIDEKGVLKLDVGHDADYYSRMENRALEAFANLFAMGALQDEGLEQIRTELPYLYDEFMKLLGKEI